MATLTVSKENEKRVKALGFLSNKGTDNFSGRIVTRNGKITADQQIAIGEAAKKFGNGNVTYTTRLTVEVQGSRAGYRRNWFQSPSGSFLQGNHLPVRTD